MGQGKTSRRRTQRARRHARIHKRVRGTKVRPRLVVSRSLRHIEGQLVDDDRGTTLLGVSTRLAEVRDRAEDDAGKVGASYEAGKLLAERAKESGVEEAVFDRAGYPYHGRVKAFAEGAREGGLRF